MDGRIGDQRGKLGTGRSPFPWFLSDFSTGKWNLWGGDVGITKQTWVAIGKLQILVSPTDSRHSCSPYKCLLGLVLNLVPQNSKGCPFLLAVPFGLSTGRPFGNQLPGLDITSARLLFRQRSGPSKDPWEFTALRVLNILFWVRWSNLGWLFSGQGEVFGGRVVIPQFHLESQEGSRH